MIAPLPGGLYPLTDQQIDLTCEALGHYAGSLADTGRDWRPAAQLQQQLTRREQP
jgi:Ser/Thr protein kinase RdoA (MazF antagonist)